MCTKKNKYIMLFVLSFIFIVSTVVGLTSINNKGFAQTKTPIVMTFDNQDFILTAYFIRVRVKITVTSQINRKRKRLIFVELQITVDNWKKVW